MNPFLEIPAVERLIIRSKSLFGKPHIKVTNYTARILPGEIVYHKPNGQGGSILHLRSGHTVETTLSQETIDEARQTYDTILKKNPGRTENLCIVMNPKQVNGTEAVDTKLRAVNN